MSLPSTGSLAMSQVNVELGRAATAPLSLNEPPVRTLAGVSTYSGTPISMSNLRGKSGYTPMTATFTGEVRHGFDSSTGGGVAQTAATVYPTGGSGGYTYSWTIASQSGDLPTLSNSTSQSCLLSCQYVKGSDGQYSVTLQCVITDNTGHSITVTNVVCEASWGLLN